MSVTPGALDQAEVQRVAITVEIVLVDDGGENGSRQLAGFRFAARVDRWSRPADDQPLVSQLEDQLDHPGAVGAHHRVEALCAGEGEIPVIAERRAGAAAGVGGGKAPGPKEAGFPRNKN